MRIGILLLFILSFVGISAAQQCAAGSALACQRTNKLPAPQLKPVIDVRDFTTCGSSNDTTAFSARLAAIGSSNAGILLSCTPLLSTITIPANLTLDASPGGGINVVTGQTVTIQGPIIPIAQQIFFNALASQGNVDLTGNLAIDRVYPEWWGASPNASATTNTSAIQASIYGAFGCDPDACRTNSSGNFKYNRELHFNGIYSVNGTLNMTHVNGFLLTGEGKLNSGLVQSATNKSLIYGTSWTYGQVSSMRFEADASQNAGLVVIDQGVSGDLDPQNITFQDVFFVGNGLGYIGLDVLPSGAAQGDNIRCLYCYVSGFTYAGVRSLDGQNADITIQGGDFQGNTNYGIYVGGGGLIINGTTMENGTIQQTGYDIVCTELQFECDVDNVRSESFHFISGDKLRVHNSYNVWQAKQWDTSSLAGSAGFLNEVVSGSTHSGQGGTYYYVTTAGTWGGLNSTNATGGSLSTIVCSTCSWTTNAFAGMQATIVSGTGEYESALITSNTATTITVPAWTTPFVLNQTFYTLSPVNYVVSGVAPDSTSVFVVEPNFGTQTTSEGVTFAAVPGAGIAGDTAIDDAILENVIIAGLPIGAVGNFKNVIVTRPDGFPSNVISSAVNKDTYEDVRAEVPCHQCVSSTWIPLNWSFTRNASGGETIFNGFSQNSLNGPNVWGVSQLSAGPATNDVEIGGRSDPASTTNVSRTILQVGGLLGPPTPIGLNQNAGSLRGWSPFGFNCGLSTGNGTPGTCNWYGGVAGVSGTQVNPGSVIMSLSPNSGLTSANGFVGNLAGNMVTLAWGPIQRVSYGFTTVENPLSDGGHFMALGGTVAAPEVPSARICQPPAAPATLVGYGVYWSGRSWANDQYSQATIATLVGVSQVNLVVRATGSSYYEFSVTKQVAGNPSYRGSALYKVTSGVSTQIGSPVAIPIGVGDVWRLTVQGTTFTVAQNGIVVFAATDSTFSSGSAGFALLSDTAAANSQISSWSAGDIVPGILSWQADNGTIDNGISRLGPASLAIGNGTQGDASAALAFGTLTLGGGTVIKNSNAVPQVSTPTVGQAACIKSAGPPVVIGYCSTVVGSGGACACN